MSKRNEKEDDKNGFAEWGSYMAAKKAKLSEQFKESATIFTKKESDIFKGVAIFVNGYTNPTAEELKSVMAAHGGLYHHYQVSTTSIGGTTHIIASNLPNVKIKQLGNVPVVKPNWITESVAAEKLLDYRKYLLYSNLDRNQPKLDFPTVANEEAIKSKTLTAADPGFLAEFYNNSRLHLISTLGSEYKQLVTQLREKSNGKFPGREKLKHLNKIDAIDNNNDPVVMHIDMDCFFVSVGLRNRLELKGVPVAVTHAKNSQGSVHRSEASANMEFELVQKYFPHEKYEKIEPRGSMSEIASCSYEARKCGIRNGMFLGPALKLCPNLQTIPYDFQGYREVSTVLYKTIAAYTLDIEAVSCDEMYVDVGPLLREFNINVEQWATFIREEIMQATGCPCSTGFGANRLQARLATRRAKPAGQFHLKQEQVEEYIAEVPLADLPGVGNATLAKLEGLGLKTCRDVQITPLVRLQAELGQKTGETILEQARGIDRKPLNFQHERKSVSADVNYGIRFKDKIEALNFLESLSMEVFNRLQEIGMRARCLTLKLLVRAPEAPQETAKYLGCGICNAVNRSTTTHNLISDAATIFNEAKSLFERANLPPKELRGVGIQLTRLEKAPPLHTALSRFLQKTTTQHTVKNNGEVPAYTITDSNEPKGDTISRILETPQQNTVKPEAKIKTNENPTLVNKRGRRKDVTKPNKKPINDLNNYFKPQKVTTTLFNRIKPIDIDLNVLNELSEELRQEIIKEYGLEEKIHSTNLQEQREEKPCTSKTPSSFDGLNWDELKPIILNWLNSDKKPSKIDVSMLAEYLKQLVAERKIETLKKMLSFLYRHVTKRGLCSWHDAYWTIINTVQEGMVLEYGATLFVERHFACDQHCV